MVADPVIELKPRGIMELFDRALRMYRGNFLKFVGIIAVAEVPLQLFQMLLNMFIYQGLVNRAENSTAAYLTTQNSASLVVTFSTLALSYIFVYGLATAALTRAIADSYLGEEVTIFGAYRKIRQYWGSLIVALLLIFLLVLAMLVWAVIPCIGWFTGFGMLFFAGLVVTPLVAPVIVIERRGASSAIRRAWEMARRRFWWLTGFFLLLALFNLLVVQGPVQIVTAALTAGIIRGASTANLATTAALQAISTPILTLLLSLIFIPLASTCATLMYFDLRVRQEGFDLTLMASQAAGTPLNAIELASQAPANPAGPIITWKEMGYFAIFSIIVAALYFLLYAIILAVLLIAMGGVRGF
jgi:hypothetical protein